MCLVSFCRLVVLADWLDFMPGQNIFPCIQSAWPYVVTSAPENLVASLVAEVVGMEQIAVAVEVAEVSDFAEDTAFGNLVDLGWHY